MSTMNLSNISKISNWFLNLNSEIIFPLLNFSQCLELRGKLNLLHSIPKVQIIMKSTNAKQKSKIAQQTNK